MLNIVSSIESDKGKTWNLLMYTSLSEVKQHFANISDTAYELSLIKVAETF